MTGAWAKTIENTKPRKTAWSMASYAGPSDSCPELSHRAPATASHA
jgi:hypothetical protein